MALSKEELIDWLKTLPEGSMIGIEEGGLCLLHAALAKGQHRRNLKPLILDSKLITSTNGSRENR